MLAITALAFLPGFLQASPAPSSSSSPGQGQFSNLSTDDPTFKEVDYIGHQIERRRYTDASDFTLDFPAQEGKPAVGKGGSNLLVDINNKPSLYDSNSMSQSMFNLLPCGLNVPHSHPRAGKVMHVLKGQVNVGFVEENGGRAIGRNLTVGQSYIIPAGLAMWIHNLACEPAQYIDTWQNSDAGILNLVEALFKMPLETVAAALQVDVTAAQALMNRQLSPIELGPAECLARCNATSASLNTLYGPQLSPVATLNAG